MPQTTIELAQGALLTVGGEVVRAERCEEAEACGGRGDRGGAIKRYRLYEPRAVLPISRAAY